MARVNPRRPKLNLEPLEGRQMMDTAAASAVVSALDTPAPVKRFAYVTNDRTRVVINLVGNGTLAGTTFDTSTNSLNLLYDNTNRSSQIIGHVSGGNGRANLRVLRDADVPAFSQSGVGENLVGLVALKAFSLVPGGVINLNGGVRKLKISEVSANSQVLLRDLPEDDTSSTDTTEGRNVVSQADGFGGEQVVLINGEFVPVFFVGDSSDITTPPSGIRIQIDRITGTFTPVATDATTASQALGDPQIFGYDATAGLLLRFDALTGAVTGQVSMPSLDPTSAGVSLGRANGQLVVAVGQADTIRVLDAQTLASVGQFTTSNLGLTSIDGLAKTDTQLAVVQGASDSSAGFSQLINLTASLATGQAVALGKPYQFATGVSTTTGASGVAGYEAFAATTLATFDQFQPLTPLPGIGRLSTAQDVITQLSLARSTAVPTPPPTTGQAIGAVDQTLAVNQGVVQVTGANGVVQTVNQVKLLKPTSLAAAGSVNLLYASPLAGLSESYRPTLAGAALFDIQGDVQAFIVNDANGVVLNDTGILHLLAARRMSNSVVLGFPIGHVDVIRRSNVDILSIQRPVGSRGGVTVNKNLVSPGPLTLP